MPPDLRTRLTLRPPEAAAWMGLTEPTFRREILPALERAGGVFRTPGATLVIVETLAQHVRDRAGEARAEAARAEADAGGLEKKLHNS